MRLCMSNQKVYITLVHVKLKGLYNMSPLRVYAKVLVEKSGMTAYLFKLNTEKPIDCIDVCEDMELLHNTDHTSNPWS